MTAIITDNDLLRLKIRPKPPAGEAIEPLTSVDPNDESNKDRFSITDYWTDITTSPIKSDISFFLNGDKGAGKSYCNMTLGYGAAQHLAEKKGGKWNDWFNIDLIAIMLPDETADLIKLDAKWCIKDYDDVSPGYNSRAFASKDNREQNDIVITNRTENNIQLWSAPDQGMTDKVLRETCNYYGEAERNERAIANGFNVLRIFRTEKNKRTGDRYYKSLWYDNKKIVKFLLKSDYYDLKILFEEYDKKRERNANKIKKMKEERKAELERQKEERAAGRKTGVSEETKKKAWEIGTELNLEMLKGSTKTEAMRNIGLKKGTYDYYVGCGLINRDGTPIDRK